MDDGGIRERRFLAKMLRMSGAGIELSDELKQKALEATEKDLESKKPRDRSRGVTNVIRIAKLNLDAAKAQAILGHQESPEDNAERPTMEVLEAMIHSVPECEDEQQAAETDASHDLEDAPQCEK